MTNFPKLTSDQRKRFCSVLVSSRFYPSMQKAKQAINSDLRCRSVFLRLAPHFSELSDFEYESISDIADLYIVDDKLNCTDNLVNQSVNCPDNKSVDSLNCTDNKDSNCTDKKTRGKQKSPTLIKYDIRISKDALSRLSQLDGTVSQHIRQAIDRYLDDYEKLST